MNTDTLKIDEYIQTYSSNNALFAFITAVERNDEQTVEWLLSDTKRADFILQKADCKTSNLKMLDIIYDAWMRTEQQREENDQTTHPLLFTRYFADDVKYTAFWHFVDFFKKDMFYTMMHLDSEFSPSSNEEDNLTIRTFFEKYVADNTVERRFDSKLAKNLFTAMNCEFWGVAWVLVEMGAQMETHSLRQVMHRSTTVWAPRFVEKFKTSRDGKDCTEILEALSAFTKVKRYDSF